MFWAPNPSGIAHTRKSRCNACHGHQIARGHLGRPDRRGEDQRRRGPPGAPGRQPVRLTGQRPKAGRCGCKATVGLRSRLRRSGNASTAAWGWLEVECNRCKTPASLPLDATRRPRDDGYARDHAVSVGGKQNPCRVFPTGVSPVDDERRALTHGGSSRTVITR